MKVNRRFAAALVPTLLALSLQQAVLAAPVELTVEDSIALALRNNHDVRYARSAQDKAYWALKQAKGNKGISLDYTNLAERSDKNLSLTGDKNEFLHTLGVSLPLYSGGRLENQVKQADLNLTVAKLEVEAARQQLKLEVVTDYLAVLEYRHEVQVNQDTVKNYEDHLNLVKSKYEIGLVAKTDVLASEVDLANAQDNLIQAQNNYNNALAALNNTLGLPHDAEVLLKDSFGQEKEALLLDECLRYALLNRPELAQYEAKAASAQYDIKIAKSGRLPTVSLSAQQNWYDKDWPGTDESNWLVGVTTSFNVFDSGVTKAKIEQAKRSADMVDEQYQTTRDTILLSVRQAYLSMAEAEKRIATNAKTVAQAEENLMIQKARYQVGVGTNLDLRDTVLALDTAKKNYFKALYDYNTSKAQLEQAMGKPVQ